MKKFITAMLISGVTLLSVNAQQSDVQPNCASVDEIIEVLKQRGVTNIVELQSKDGMWVAETIDENGKRSKEIIVYCSDAKLGTLEAKEIRLSTPPADGVTLDTILSSVKSGYGGQIYGVEFKAGKWIVELSLPYRNSPTKVRRHKIYYDAYGKVILNTMTD